MNDRIEKTVDLKAPVERVWRALTDHVEFGRWFQVAMEGPFKTGEQARGRIVHPGAPPDLVMTITVVAMEPPRRFAFTWHPYAVDPNTDYSAETPTTVEFLLTPTPEGTRLAVSESGFDAVPAHRRALALKMNDGGWAAQMQNIKAFVERADAGA